VKKSRAYARGFFQRKSHSVFSPALPSGASWLFHVIPLSLFQDFHSLRFRGTCFLSAGIEKANSIDEELDTIEEMKRLLNGLAEAHF
jgi:hypothetical protein